MKKLDETLDIRVFGCFAHLLNLIVKKSFSCFGKIKDPKDHNHIIIVFKIEKYCKFNYAWINIVSKL